MGYIAKKKSRIYDLLRFNSPDLKGDSFRFGFSNYEDSILFLNQWINLIIILPSTLTIRKLGRNRNPTRMISLKCFRSKSDGYVFVYYEVDLIGSHSNGFCLDV